MYISVKSPSQIEIQDIFKPAESFLIFLCSQFSLPQEMTIQILISIGLPVLGLYINGIMQDLHLHICLLLLIIMAITSHIFLVVSLVFLSIVNIIPLKELLLILSPVDKHLRYFQFGIIMNKVVLKVMIRFFVCKHTCLYHLGKCKQWNCWLIGWMHV